MEQFPMSHGYGTNVSDSRTSALLTGAVSWSGYMQPPPPTFSLPIEGKHADEHKK
jgi:hypothetical protein